MGGSFHAKRNLPRGCEGMEWRQFWIFEGVTRSSCTVAIGRWASRFLSDRQQAFKPLAAPGLACRALISARVSVRSAPGVKSANR